MDLVSFSEIMTGGAGDLGDATKQAALPGATRSLSKRDRRWRRRRRSSIVGT